MMLGHCSHASAYEPEWDEYLHHRDEPVDDGEEAEPSEDDAGEDDDEEDFDDIDPDDLDHFDPVADDDEDE